RQSRENGAEFLGPLLPPNSNSSFVRQHGQGRSKFLSRGSLVKSTELRRTQSERNRGPLGSTRTCPWEYAWSVVGPPSALTHSLRIGGPLAHPTVSSPRTATKSKCARSHTKPSRSLMPARSHERASYCHRGRFRRPVGQDFQW